MKISRTKLENVLLIKLDIFEDHRGEYVELYNEKLYKSKGIEVDFVEDDISIATRGVIKGVHGDSLTWKPEIRFEKTLEDLLNYWRNYYKVWNL